MNKLLKLLANQSLLTMKHTVYLLFILFFTFIQLHAQVISGYVYDEAENKPLEGAFVYLDGTTISTSTDSSGYFLLKPGAVYNVPLIITYVGFENLVLEKPFSYDKPVKVMLRESSISLDEVVINKNLPFTRKQMLKAFREQFLGTSAAGRSCAIENEDDIKLTYNLSTNTLQARCAVPIRIKNKHLEYNIAFSLVDFEVGYNTLTLSSLYLNRSFFSGTTAYIDVSKNGSAEKKRKKVYLGSIVHFMKTIAANEWSKEKFQLYVDRWPASAVSHFKITDSLSFKKIVSLDAEKEPETVGYKIDKATGKKEMIKYKKPTNYAVMYDGKQQSAFEMNKRFYVDENGFFTPIQDVVFSGYMSTLKAGDLLPANYKYKP